MGVDQSKWIDPDELSDDERRVLEFLIEKFHQAGELEKISDQRDEDIIDIAKRDGFDDAGAARIKDHFNAATEKIRQMSPEDKTRFYDDLKAKLG